jgi:tRNA pseudouridine38-40 synthase
MEILLTVAYDGTNYCGWQFQENGVSVFETLEQAIKQTIGTDALERPLLGASRTDAGVHALGQRAHLALREPLKIPSGKLPQVLNSALPKDIAVTFAEQVSAGFHPIWDAKSKTYVYKIFNHNHRNPLLWPYSAFVPELLDISAMHEACRHFIGEHDFAAFCAAGSSAKTTVRQIYSLCVTKQNHVIEITINGTGFLYNMVRIIAGTLVFVGLGKIGPGDIPAIILSKDRTKAGKTMPAKGLTLLEIFY